MILLILENQSSSFPNKEDTELEAVQEPKKKRSNSKYTETEQYLRGKYAAVNGADAGVREFKKLHPYLKLSESMLQNLRNRYL